MLFRISYKDRLNSRVRRIKKISTKSVATESRNKCMRILWNTVTKKAGFLFIKYKKQ
jgi:hypothetical protein